MNGVPEWEVPFTDRCPETPPPEARRPTPQLPRVYVAAAMEDFERARAAMALLRLLGCEVTHDWTDDVEAHQATPPTREELIRYALLDRTGVEDAHVLLVLTPETKDKGCGMWAELGMAIAQAKRIVITGPLRDRCIFGAFAHKHASDLEGVLAVVEA